MHSKVWKMTIVEKVSKCDNNVGYNSKMEGYTTFMSDINKLYAIMEEERLVVEECINVVNVF